ncbi:hypothetical protein OHJ28_03795 [Dickeya fangzhongdai]|uniref:hypothetical protein n=1 Tax=Dickeya TaxID=204037 RepID=UPI0006763F22|nr:MULTISPECIES: hypothetical protein [Dickeya]
MWWPLAGPLTAGSLRTAGNGYAGQARPATIRLAGHDGVCSGEAVPRAKQETGLTAIIPASAIRRLR